jgi:hypothetical protein
MLFAQANRRGEAAIYLMRLRAQGLMFGRQCRPYGAMK